MMNARKSGILMHITSLPASYGIGDLGPEAYRFADFLVRAKQAYWQVLPLHSTSIACDNSPYNSISAFAGNTLLISPQLLVKEGLLSRKDLEPVPEFPEGYCDYQKVSIYKERIFRQAYGRFREKREYADTYRKFCSADSHWLDDYALFVIIKRQFKGKAWSEWPAPLRDRAIEALAGIKDTFSEDIEKEKFLQYLFFRQWSSLKRYCSQKGIKLIGDIPIYVTYDSSDVWTNTGLFILDKDKKPSFASGVPPDYFSKTGQLWGNPVYRWEALKKTGYKWWIERFRHCFGLFDILRVDHFRGFVAFWQVSSREKTAIKGRWVKAPGEDFFRTLLKKFHGLPIIAEDLGIITPDVKKVMKEFGFPGMRILLFAFGEDNPYHPYLPHNFIPNCAVYTGTHDNNTIKGWFKNDAGPKGKARLFDYLGHKVSYADINWELIKLAESSIANTVIIPIQDVLGLGDEARMNRPFLSKGNWKWRLSPHAIEPSIVNRLSKMTELEGRS